MGGGGGGPTTLYTSGVGGQGGGRIIPGTSTNLSPWAFVTSTPGSAVSIITDNRYNTTSLSYLFSDTVGAPPSAAGQVGRGAEYVVWSYDSNGTLGQVKPTSGAGGGWGAQGGTSSVTGAAGGKAINTVGNTVTWIGGSSRVYGVVG
jgi:hypothetical protein